MLAHHSHLPFPPTVMPTPAERKALLFLAGLAVLGSGVRAVRVLHNDSSPDAPNRLALRAQIQAVDSVRARLKPARAKKPAKPPVRRRSEQAVARRPDPPGPQPNYVIVPQRDGWNQPGAPTGRRLPTPQPPLPIIDLDIASSADIERLPYIGKRLAERIVANRDSFGPFGSLEEFQRVRGVGAALAERVKQNVTFSATPRPFDVDEHRRRRGGTTRQRRAKPDGRGSR
ncbi:MAG: helix-hairpin-helix domain-containing protein [Anaerolineae bacterium]|nr:helix-hairpin-helix domain-containing protein [Gemmatimonadaceae bacterium]